MRLFWLSRMTAGQGITGRQARAARYVVGAAQREIADAAGFSRSALSHFETGRRGLSAQAMARLVAVYAARGVTFREGGRDGVFWERGRPGVSLDG